ncbi:MAG: 50S ribosomal protein L21 [Acidobacteriota bacterium]
MFAVIETGGKQYRVAPGETVVVETLAGEAGTAVEFDRVVAVGKDDGTLVTGPEAASARVLGEIQKHGRGDKVIVFKFKRKKQYKRTIGHRQNFTAVKISDIVL